MSHELNLQMRWRRGLVVGLWVALLAGCGGQTTQKAAVEAPENLTVLADAYVKANDKLGTAPKGPDELRPFLPKDADLQKILRSARDGEPFVVIWGTNPREGMDLKPQVIAYEKKGHRGARLVFTAMGVMEMDNATFTAARFPKGHTP